MSITHTKLDKIAFIEAVKNTDAFIKINNKSIQAIVIHKNRKDDFYDKYSQALKYGIDYLRNNPNVTSRDFSIINEILNK